MVGIILAAHTQVFKEDRVGWATASMVHARDYELPKVSEYLGTVVLSSSVFLTGIKKGEHNKQTNKSYHIGRSNDSGTLPAAAALLGGPSLINLPLLISMQKKKQQQFRLLLSA